MTKKDYELIAKVLRDSFIEFEWSQDAYKFMAFFVNNLAVELKRDNERFNIDKFKKACLQVIDAKDPRTDLRA